MREKTYKIVIKYFLLGILAVIYVIPVAMMLLGSVKNSGQVLYFDLSWPTEFNWSNYSYVWEKGSFPQGYWNSFMMTSISTLCSIVFGAFTGIVIGRRSDKISSLLYYYFLFGLTVTFQTASTFYLLKVMGLYGSIAAVIMIFISQRVPFATMTFSSFIRGVPREIDEAAIVDGCGPVRMVFQILIPIMKPIMITNLILAAIAIWNNFMIPLFYITSSSKMPITLSIYFFYSTDVRSWHYVFAALTLTVTPMIILFLFLQKYIVGGMTSGAVKG